MSWVGWCLVPSFLSKPGGAHEATLHPGLRLEGCTVEGVPGHAVAQDGLGFLSAVKSFGAQYSSQGPALQGAALLMHH